MRNTVSYWSSVWVINRTLLNQILSENNCLFHSKQICVSLFFLIFPFLWFEWMCVGWGVESCRAWLIYVRKLKFGLKPSKHENIENGEWHVDRIFRRENHGSNSIRTRNYFKVFIFQTRHAEIIWTHNVNNFCCISP